jgi:3-oxoacyl-[acyl-carrier protein] reductase
MDLGIAGRKALVMGASRGLGRAVAEALIREGVTTAICARNQERLESAAREIGAQPFPADLSKRGVTAQLVADVVARLGALDILVVNTGGPPPRTFDNTGDQDWRDAFEALWMSGVAAIRAALPGMRERTWGRILVVTSIAAREPIANLMLSNSLRAGLHGLVNALSKECASQGITVNAVMPGYTLTERLIEVGVKEAEIASRIPAGRMAKPAEFAALAAFLASDCAGYITGQAIACDGGLLQSI